MNNHNIRLQKNVPHPPGTVVGRTKAGDVVARTPDVYDGMEYLGAVNQRPPTPLPTDLDLARELLDEAIYLLREAPDLARIKLGALRVVLGDL